MRKLCALVIGHKKRSPGALNTNANLSEFDFNEDLVRIPLHSGHLFRNKSATHSA
jgi:hypothetical protein